MNPDLPLYSICISHYNNVRTVRRALDSILSQVDSRFEVVVVDNFSNDGSKEILEEYLRAGKIAQLVEKRSSRGLARETAVENSRGQYIIADMDMDDVFKPELSSLLRFYHEKCEGRVLAVVADLNAAWSKNVTIGPRNLIQELGGWPDLQAYEDSNLWGRAALKDRYSWTNFSLAQTVGEHSERKGFVGKLRWKYVRYRELLRQGRLSVVKWEKKGADGNLALLLARISAPFHKSYRKNTFVDFRPRDEVYFVEYQFSPGSTLASSAPSTVPE
jgi:glycosyltransferase involved in cell wall biosynthesis